MKKQKYKVGDRVRIVDKWPKEGGQNNEGRMDKWLGKVMTIRCIDEDGDCRMVEDREEHCGFGWLWFDRLIAGLANDADKIVVATDGKTVTAKQYDGKKVVKTAKAKCSPADTYNFKEGARLALERLLGKKEEKPAKFGPEDLKPGMFGKVSDGNWFVAVNDSLVYQSNRYDWVKDLGPNLEFPSGRTVDLVLSPDVKCFEDAATAEKAVDCILWSRNGKH